MKNGLTCDCGNPKERGVDACGRCLGIEANLWRWLPISRPKTGRLVTQHWLTESEQGARIFETRLDGLPRGAAKTGPKLYRLTCGNCGNGFVAKRKHAKMCGVYCRAKRSRLASAAA